MAFDDLRSFLQALDEQGQLLKIEEEVNAEPDLAAAANATGRIGDGAPALWFDNIRGFTDAGVVMNTIGSWQNHAISMGLPANTPVKKQIDEFILGDENCDANLLNMQNVSTIIRRAGFKHWGNRLCGTDPQWRFESVRRTADVIEDSIQETMLEYVDRPLDRENADDIIGTINAYMRQLVGLGAIFGGRAWLDEELNTAESMAAGVLYINYDFGPKSPTELISLRVRVNNNYALEEMLAA